MPNKSSIHIPFVPMFVFIANYVDKVLEVILSDIFILQKKVLLSFILR